MTYLIVDEKTGNYHKRQRLDAISKQHLGEVRKLERQFEESTREINWWRPLFPYADP